MADTTSIQVPADLAQVAEEKGIPLDLVRRGLALGFPADAIKGQLGMPGVTAEAAEQFIAAQEALRGPGGEISVPQELLEVAQKYEWPESLVKRALALGAAPDFVAKQIEAGITPAQAERFIEQQEAARTGGLAQTLDLTWMKVPTEWGIRVRPKKKGLTVGMLNVSSYADIPDVWPYQTEMPRGAYPLPGIAPMGYSIYEKAELWSDNSADLYEEAIQRRWRAATDIPWDSVEPLPEEIERAMGQLCTHLCERALVQGDMIGRWLPEMSYGYHEVKLYLSTAAFDYARQFEVFRKRAMSNGGGLGLQGPGYFHRALIDARAWTEASVSMLIFSNSHIMMLYQIGEHTAHNDAEALIFRLVMQDTARQLAYGVQHLRYFLSKKIERRAEIHNYLNKAEAVFAFDDQKDVPLREALIILLGGGTSAEQVSDGMAKLEYFRARWVRDYLSRLAAAGFPERREKLHPLLKQYVEEPAEAAA
jgi:hypothetical protein